MIYTYECQHPDCGATVEKFRTIARADDPAECPCSASHDMKRRAVERSQAIIVEGGTRGKTFGVQDISGKTNYMVGTESDIKRFG